MKYNKHKHFGSESIIKHCPAPDIVLNKVLHFVFATCTAFNIAKMLHEYQYKLDSRRCHNLQYDNVIYLKFTPILLCVLNIKLIAQFNISTTLLFLAVGTNNMLCIISIMIKLFFLRTSRNKLSYHL